MATHKLSGARWAEAREMYEYGGHTPNAIAELLDCKVQTVEKHMVAEGWRIQFKKDESVEITGTELAQNIDEIDDSAAMKARIAQLEAEAEAAKPDVEVPVLTSANVDDYLTDEMLMPIIEDKLLTERISRLDRGLAPLDASNEAYKERVDALLAQERQSRVEAQTKFSSSSTRSITTRSAKMVRPDGMQVQCILEGHVNSHRGHPNDGFDFYRRKGFKLMTPQRCLLHECWAPAAVANGQFIANGMCELHSAVTLPSQKIADVTSTELSGTRSRVDMRA